MSTVGHNEQAVTLMRIATFPFGNADDVLLVTYVLPLRWGSPFIFDERVQELVAILHI